MSFFSRLRPNLTLSETTAPVLLWMGMLLLPLAPITNRYAAGLIFSFLAITLLSRNTYVIAGTVLVLDGIARFFFTVSSWHDQLWIQWSSVSSVLTGHNILSTPPLVGMSMSNYMPMGDLFGGVFIALGIQQYWHVWHLILPFLFLTPFVLAPSLNTLLIFIGTTCFYPFNDYTTGGGTLEVAVATAIAAIALYRAGLIVPALLVFAFSAEVRQPMVILVPFVMMLLWKKGDVRGIAIFSAALLLFGGIFILSNPLGAYQWCYRIWDKYSQAWFNSNGGLVQNYTVSSLPHFFGVSDIVPWTQWTHLYLPLTLLSIAVLFYLAWRAQSADTVLALAIVAALCVYLCSRGYALYHYILSGCFPFAALIYPARQATAPLAKLFGKSAALLLLWIGLLPLTWVTFFAVSNFIRQAAGTTVLPVARTFEAPAAGPPVEIRALDGADPGGHVFPATSDLLLTFDAPVRISAIRLSGAQVPIQTVKGVPIPYATEPEMGGIITDGTIQYKGEDAALRPLLHVKNTINYNTYPAIIDLPRTDIPITSLRLHPNNLYMDHKEWVLGKVEVFARR